MDKRRWDIFKVEIENSLGSSYERRDSFMNVAFLLNCYQRAFGASLKVKQLEMLLMDNPILNMAGQMPHVSFVNRLFLLNHLGEKSSAPLASNRLP